MAAVLGGDAVFTQERQQFVDLKAGVACVADVGERVEATRGHPGDELAIVFEVKREAVGRFVVPGHDVGNECTSGERGRRCRFAAHDGMIPSLKWRTSAKGWRR